MTDLMNAIQILTSCIPVQHVFTMWPVTVIFFFHITYNENRGKLVGLAGVFIICAKTLITHDEQVMQDWFILFFSPRWNIDLQYQKRRNETKEEKSISSFNEMIPTSILDR